MHMEFVSCQTFILSCWFI